MPEGTRTDLVERLSISLATNGALANGTSFPVSPTPVDGQPFYRTDEDVVYVYDGSTWDSQGQSLSNVLFDFALGGESSGQAGIVDNANGSPDTATDLMDLAWGNSGSSYVTVIPTRWTKIAGVSTVTIRAKVRRSITGGDLRVDIGGQNGTVAIDSATWTWVNFTIDVSSLVDGTTYDVDIDLKHDNNSTNEVALLTSIIGLGS